MLSITSDYEAGTGCPERHLRAIAAAGFTHVHWCHQWCTDFLYSRWEIGRIQGWFRDFGLELLDLHASHGDEKGWCSAREYERLSGLELVRNRMEMAAGLGSDVVILHLPGAPTGDGEREALRTRVRRSLDALRPFALERGVRIAFENLIEDNFGRLRDLFAEYEPEYIGLCYDSGHGNLTGNGLDEMERVRDRLLSVHLHDNDGSGDQHLLLFSGSVDWERLAGILAASAYEKCVSMEVARRGHPDLDEEPFLRRAHDTGMRFAEMIARAREQGV